MKLAARLMVLACAAGTIAGSFQAAFAADAAAAAPVFQYALRPGDSLEQIARVFQSSPAELAQSNSLVDAAHLRAGQVLVIPNPLAADIARVTADNVALRARDAERANEAATLRKDLDAQTARLAEVERDRDRRAAEAAAARDWRSAALAALAGLLASLLWGTWTARERGRLSMHSRRVEQENRILVEARERYRSAISQLELRFQRLHGISGPRNREVEEGAATLRRIFAEGTQRIEELLAERGPEEVAEHVARPGWARLVTAETAAVRR